MNRILKFGFKVVKANNGASGTPLPNMDQYYLKDDNLNTLSFWNDIPLDLKHDEVTCCIEIPKESCAKLQMTKSVKYHPLMQDTKKNLFTKQLQLRYYAQFPLFNYGFIPQTWEQNLVKDSLGLFGDDDPIDVCDLSRTKRQIGSIYRAKILGSFCLIDQGEVDWKVLLIDAEQASRQGINDLSKISKKHIESVMKWFKTIKLFEGKKENQIAYDEKIFNKEETIELIHQTHEQWVELMSSSNPAYNELRQKYYLKP